MTTVLADPPKLGTRVERDVAFQRFGAKAVDLRGIKLVDAKTIAPGDLELINSYALKTLTAAEIAVFTAKVANNLVDRDGERFSEDVLQDFAETLPGKSLLEGHSWGPTGIGRFFKAWIEEDGGAQWLMASFYMVRSVDECAEMIHKIEAGIAWAMSVGFFAPDRVTVYGRDDLPVFGEYRRGPNGEKAEAIEASLVFLGAQYDAAVTKSAAVAHARQAKEPQPMPTDKKSLWDRVVEAFSGRDGAKITVKRVGDVEEATLEMGIKTSIIPSKTDMVPPDADGNCPEGYIYDADLNACVTKAKAAEIARAKEEDEQMDAKVLEELRAGLKTLQEGQATLQAAIAEVKVLATGAGEKVGAVEVKLEAIEKVTGDLEEFGEKILERVEGVESVLGRPKAASEDEPEPEQPAKPIGKQPKGKVFGDTLVPHDLRR